MSREHAHFFHMGDVLPKDRIIVFHRGEVLLCQESILWLPEALSRFHGLHDPLLLVEDTGHSRVLALNLPDDAVLEDCAVSRLTPRQLLLQQGYPDFALPGRASQLLNWYGTHRYCGACAAPTSPHAKDRALRCQACERVYYPRINPCVIVLVTRGDTCLLALHQRATASYHSCLAGFMEVGETPEETVKREVREEVGIEVNNIRYVRSQSWPFPSQLMLGFFAEHESGDICVDGKEIAQARWYHRDELPLTPSAQISVAGQLIELFLQGF